MFPHEVTLSNRKNYRGVGGKYQLVFQNEIKKENLETKNLGKLIGRINRDFPKGWQVFTETKMPEMKITAIVKNPKDITTDKPIKINVSKPKAEKPIEEIKPVIEEKTNAEILKEEFLKEYPNDLPTRDELRSVNWKLCERIIKEFGSYTEFKKSL